MIDRFFSSQPTTFLEWGTLTHGFRLLLGWDLVTVLPVGYTDKEPLVRQLETLLPSNNILQIKEGI